MRLKALSFRQPWAELVLRGEMTIALRTWSTDYRGPLAVYAPRKVDVEACERVGIARGSLAIGAIVGLVDLVDVVGLDEESFEQGADEHLRRRAYQEGMYGWHLHEPRRLRAPWPVAGMRQLFEVEIPDGLIVREAVIPKAEDQVSVAPFELYVVPDGRGGSGYGLALYQRGIEPEQRRLPLYLSGPGEDMAKVGELSPEKARMAAGPVLQALREADYRATDLAAGRRDPFLIGEETGVRLGLIFQAIGPVSKVARIEGIVAGLTAMPAEEAYYWYSKCSGGGKARRARRSLRILLSAED